MNCWSPSSTTSPSDWNLASSAFRHLGRAGIKNVINGPFTFGPDGNPMIGPVPGMKNYWVAVGVMAGFCQGGGVGLCMAEWMMDGEPSIDVWAMDVARFGNFATPEWGTIKSSENYERRFVMTFPNETLPKGRRQKTTALYDRLDRQGRRLGPGFRSGTCFVVRRWSGATPTSSRPSTAPAPMTMWRAR